MESVSFAYLLCVVHSVLRERLAQLLGGIIHKKQ